MLGAFLFLHRRQRDLDSPATRRFVNTDDLKRSFKQLDRVADLYFAPFLPLGVDDRLVTPFQFSAFADGDARDVRVLVVVDAVNQTLTKTGVALVERLTDCGRGPDAGNSSQLCGVRSRQTKLRRAESDRSRRANHDLRAYV